MSEEREGAARSQHVVLQGPADARTMAAAMRPGVERSRGDEATAGPSCLVMTPTVEQALRGAEVARTILADDTSRVVPVSGVTRARRLLADGPVAVVTGTAADLLALRRDSALQLDGLKAVVLIGLDEQLADDARAALEAVLAEVPSEALRIATLDTMGESVEAFLDAQLRKARRLAPPPAVDTLMLVTPRYLVTSAAGRTDALRAILDGIDPPSLQVVVASDASAADATSALVQAGYLAARAETCVVRQPAAGHVSLVVLWDVPTSAEALTAALVATPVHAIALVSPADLPAFVRLTSGQAEPWTAPERTAMVAGRLAQVRQALHRAVEASRQASASDLALLEPLLNTVDPVTLAAAAVRLYEETLTEMGQLRAATAATMARVASGGRTLSVVQGGADAAGAGSQRLFLGVGKRDGVRVGDIVGAIANEAGIDGDRIGAIQLFESHALVELGASDAAKAVGALASATLRGRRLNARIDDRPAMRDERPARGDRPDRKGLPRASGDRRPPRDGARPSGPPRGKGSRDGERRGSFRPDEARRAFGDRPARERTENTREWAERGSRMAHAKRPPRPRPERSNEE